MAQPEDVSQNPISTMESHREVHVAIIGAGVAGLTCAARLREQDPSLDVIVLEADDRVGGRACQVEVGGHMVDAGAGWIHGVLGNPLIEDGILNADDIIECCSTNIWIDGPQSGDSTNFHPTSEERTRWQRRLAHVTELEAEAERCKTQFAGLAAALRAFPEDWTSTDERFLRGFELWFGAPAEELCAVEWGPGARLGDFPGPHAVVHGGMQLLATRLLQRAGGIQKVMLGAVTESVQRDEVGFTVNYIQDGCNRVLHASWLICTVSLGALQQARPTFTPALPGAVLTSIAALRMSDYCKCILALSEDIASSIPTWNWTDHEFFPMAFNYFSVKHIPVVACTSVRRELVEMEDDTIVCEAAAALGFQRSDILSYRITRWKSEGWSYGSYSFSPLGCDFTEADAFLEVTDLGDSQYSKQLIFAGEHTHDEHQGSVHGAYLSGCRAAQQVISARDVATR